MERVSATSPISSAAGAGPEQGAGDVAAMVERARRAQPVWAALGTRERARLLRKMARALARDEEIVRAIIAETGKPRYEAEAIEVLYTCELTRFLTSRRGRRALRPERRRAGFFVTKELHVSYRPHGVVGVIGPANWPLLNNYADAVAPLLAGNAVVLKPSPLTSLASHRAVALWSAAGLPADVLQVARGGAATGEALARTADMVLFTGSTDGGRAIAQVAAERLIPAVLELGGKSPMIVLAGADLNAAVGAALWSGFANGGQVCIRTERVLVASEIADEFVRRLAGRMRSLRQGVASPADEDVDLGPSGTAANIARAERQIAEAVAQGARVVVGGERRVDLPEGFLAPTLLDGVTPEMAVAREETFAPVLPVLRVRDAEHAIALANSLPVGLSAIVFAGSRREGLRVAAHLQAGSVCVDDALVNYFCVEAPLGGWKGSGLGFRHGAECLRQFVRTETVVVDSPLLGWITRALVAPRIAFPYRAAMTRLFRRFMRWRY